MWNGVGWVNAPSVFSSGILERPLSFPTGVAVISKAEKGILVSAFPNPFSPDGDGISGLALFSVSTPFSSDPSYAALRIRSLSGALVREISFPMPGIWGMERIWEATMSLPDPTYGSSGLDHILKSEGILVAR